MGCNVVNIHVYSISVWSPPPIHCLRWVVPLPWCVVLWTLPLHLCVVLVPLNPSIAGGDGGLLRQLVGLRFSDGRVHLDFNQISALTGGSAENFCGLKQFR